MRVSNNDNNDQKPKNSDAGFVKKKLIIACITIPIIVTGIIYTLNFEKQKKLEASISLGDKYIKESRYEDAIVQYSKSIYLDSDSDAAKDALANAYISLGRDNLMQYNLDKAKESFSSALDIDKDNPKAYIYVSQSYASVEGYIEYAIEILNKGYERTKDESILKKKLEILKSFPGNTSNNLLNRGYVVESAQWVYYVNISENGAIYRMKQDGSGKVKLGAERACFLNVVDQWIYYASNNTIYKMKIDGSEVEKIREVRQDASALSEDFLKNGNSIEAEFNAYLKGEKSGINYIKGLEVSSEGIYYAASVNVRYRGWAIILDSKGTVRKQLKLNTSPTGLAVVNNDIYYWGGSSLSASPIFKLSTNDGASEVEADILGARIFYMNVCNEAIYYILDEPSKDNSTAEMKMYRKNANSSEKYNIRNMNRQELSIKSINVQKGLIYYVEDGWLYKYDMNGDNQLRLCEIPPVPYIYINTAGEWIYITALDEYDSYNSVKDTMFRIKSDGTQKQVIR